MNVSEFPSGYIWITIVRRKIGIPQLTSVAATMNLV
jgi:hypothetical protein